MKYVYLFKYLRTCFAGNANGGETRIMPRSSNASNSRLPNVNNNEGYSNQTGNDFLHVNFIDTFFYIS